MKIVLSRTTSQEYWLGGSASILAQANPSQALERNIAHSVQIWENVRIAIEHDSDLYHINPEQIYQDARRRTDLTGVDIAVFTVTAHQMRHLREFDHHIHPITKKLGKRIRTPLHNSQPTDCLLRVKPPLT